MLFGVPQGLVLGPLLFNIILCELFLAVKSIDLVRYANDTTPYFCGKTANVTVI